MPSSDRNGVQTSFRPLRSISNHTNPSRMKKEKSIEKTSGVVSSKRAFVLENEGLSLVPYFKRSPIPRESKHFQWSINEFTNQPTITRKENYANGRWSEVPNNLVLPDPPSNWLKEKPERNCCFEDEGIYVSGRSRLSSFSSIDESSNDSSSTHKSGNDSGYEN